MRGNLDGSGRVKLSKQYALDSGFTYAIPCVAPKIKDGKELQDSLLNLLTSPLNISRTSSKDKILTVVFE